MLYGRDFQLKPDGTLDFLDGIMHPEPDVRRLGEARYVFHNSQDLPDELPLYYMYRGVFHQGDERTYQAHDIRYDITVLCPGMVGAEFIKTVGHFHPAKNPGGETFPEYYEVLSGEALYILQKNTRSGDVEEIMAVEAKKGDRVFIPSGYGHVTINPADSFLVMANLIERNFASLYEPFRDKRGAAYLYVAGENGKGQFTRNDNYHNSVGLQVVAAPNLKHPTDSVKNHPLYAAFMENPDAFSFLR